MTEKLLFAGLGGQGILLGGEILTQAILDMGKEVTFLPTYEGKVRGGTVNCNIVVSDKLIGSPVIDEADVLVAMCDQALDDFTACVVPGGKIIVNSTLVKKTVERDDVTTYYVPCTQIAIDNGNARSSNMAMIGAYAAVSGLIGPDEINTIVAEIFSGSKARFADANKKIVQAAYDYLNG